jgi:hypothetical protein
VAELGEQVPDHGPDEPVVVCDEDLHVLLGGEDILDVDLDLDLDVDLDLD